MDEKQFEAALKANKIPTLVLDQKWHRLFAIGGKPAEVQELEIKSKEILLRQGHLNQELKSLKKIKQDLMNGIVANMEGADAQAANTVTEKNLKEPVGRDQCQDRRRRRRTFGYPKGIKRGQRSVDAGDDELLLRAASDQCP